MVTPVFRQPAMTISTYVAFSGFDEDKFLSNSCYLYCNFTPKKFLKERLISTLLYLN